MSPMNTFLFTDVEARGPRADRLIDALDAGELHGLTVHGHAVHIAVGAAASRRRDGGRPAKRPMLVAQ